MPIRRQISVRDCSRKCIFFTHHHFKILKIVVLFAPLTPHKKDTFVAFCHTKQFIIIKWFSRSSYRPISEWASRHTVDESTFNECCSASKWQDITNFNRRVTVKLGRIIITNNITFAVEECHKRSRVCGVPFTILQNIPYRVLR